MAQIKHIVESLIYYDRAAVDRLYRSAPRAGFYYATRPDETIMFIFPDGRMLGGENTIEQVEDEFGDLVDDISRSTFHHHIYAFVDQDKRDPDLYHPLQDDKLNEYYNLVVVVPLDEDGTVYIPERTVPTKEQLIAIQDLADFGYDVIDLTGYRFIDIPIEEYDEYIQSMNLD